MSIILVDAVALIVQIYLQQNRNDLALKEVTAARRWAQDSLLVNLAESWVGLRLVSSRTSTLGGNVYAQQGLIRRGIYRAVRDTSKHSTSLRNWHRLRPHRQYGVSFRKPLRSYTLDGQKRQRLLWIRP
jgi:hypothetical protein